MFKQQIFPFHEVTEKPFTVEIREVEATEEEKKEMVDTLSSIIFERIKKRMTNNPLIQEIDLPVM